MTNQFSEFDGPRRIRRDELLASIRLGRLCFGGPETIHEDEILASAILPRIGGEYILANQGKLVSSVSITHDHIKMYDGIIHSASIGGMCTHPDYRNQGLATHLLEYCTQKLAQEGARLMLISGDNGLYTRLGNVLHGRFLYFSIKLNQGIAWRPTPKDLTLRRMTSADILAVSRLYQAEPVHYIRKYSHFLTAINHPMWNTYTYADQWIVERSGQALAYLLLGSPWEIELGAGIRQVGEFAGSRLAMVDALKTLLFEGRIKELAWPVSWQDLELIQLLQECGYHSQLAPLEGHTYRIVNFPGFMRDLRPILQARFGEKLLRGLRFEQSGPILGGAGNDRYSIIRGSDRLDLDGAAMTRLVMGTTEMESDTTYLPGVLAEIVPALFPLPSFLPGINYR